MQAACKCTVQAACKCTVQAAYKCTVQAACKCSRQGFMVQVTATWAGLFEKNNSATMRLLKQVLSFALDFFLIYVKMTSTQFLAEIYFVLQMIVL